MILWLHVLMLAVHPKMSLPFDRIILAEKAWQDGHLGKEVVEAALPPISFETQGQWHAQASSIEKVRKAQTSL